MKVRKESLLVNTKGFPSVARYIKQQDDEIEISTLDKYYIEDIDNINPIKFTSSFSLDGSFYYIVLDRIDIKLKKQLQSVADNIPMSVVGKFILIKRTNGNEEQVREWNDIQIHALMTVDNSWFNVNRNILSTQDNNGSNEIHGKITASYLYNSKKSFGFLDISQPCITISDWKIKSEIAVDIEIKHSAEIISNKGGNIPLKVFKTVRRKLYKDDEYGNILREREEIDKDIDVTYNSELQVNSSSAIIKNNELVIPQQMYDAESREYIVTAYYEGLTDNIVIKQESGEKSDYETILSFQYPSKVLYDASETTLEIPFTSVQNKICEGKIIDTMPLLNLTIYSDVSWINKLTYTEGKLIAHIESNNEQTREGNIIIYYNTIKDTLKIIQPSKKLINSFYSLQISGGGQFTIDTIESAYIAIKCLRNDFYDDGETMQKASDKKITIDYDWYCSNDGANGGVVQAIDFDGNYVIKPLILRKDVAWSLNGKLSIENQSYGYTINFIPYASKMVEINVVVQGEHNNDVFATKTGELIVIDNDNHESNTYDLQPLWLNSFMKSDNIFKMSTLLNITHNYTFLISGVVLNNQQTINYQEQYLIEEDDVAIDINLKL